MDRQSDLPLAFGLALAAAIVLERGLSRFLGSFAATATASAAPASPDSQGSLPANATLSQLKKVKGVGSFDGQKVALWIVPILRYARSHGWKGTVNSGYRSLADQTRIYNSGVRPAAVPGTSNHEGDQWPRGAVDVTDAQQLSDILKKSPFGKILVWAGSKDPVHFSFPHNGSY